MSAYHLPVLLKPSVDALVQNPGGTYVDATFGGGGHSREILSRLNNEGRLYAFDQDPEAAANAIDDKRFTFIPSNFRFMENYLTMHGVEQVDGILADLGVSSHQLDKAERGFSFRWNEILDMRMNPAQSVNASRILQQYTQAQLRDLFRKYAEFPHANRLAERIVKQRITEPVNRPEQLRNLLRGLVHPTKINKTLQVILQALRIEVNDELGALFTLLQTSVKLLKKGGRLVLISYHSLEDRPVKNFMRAGNFVGTQAKDLYGNVASPLKPVKIGAITPDEHEIEINPRARSAKMRIAEKL